MSGSRWLGIAAVIGGVAAQAAAFLQYLKPGLAATLGVIALFIAGGTERAQGGKSKVEGQ